MSDSSFLDNEYKFCFDQLRYYDARQEGLLKYLFTLTSATATAQFALLKLMGKPTTEFFLAQGFLFLVVFLASLLLYLMMLQNRLYFVFVARQINAIRKLQTEATAFTENQLYTSITFSAFKCSSVHTLQMIGVAIISSLFAAVSVFGLLHAMTIPSDLTSAVFVCIAVGLAEFIGGALYLKIESAKPADEAVHRC